MLTGLLGGIFWALETVIIGIAMSLSPFIENERAVFLAPLVATFLHDGFSAVFAFIYNTARGRLRPMLSAAKSPALLYVVLGAVIGGPVGMTGYLLAVNSMGSAVGAVASAIYPAIGTFLAWLFLKERVRWYQWIFLAMALLGVVGLSYSPSAADGNFLLGILGAAMCAVGWGTEAVILAGAFKRGGIKNDYALVYRQASSAFAYGAVVLPIVGGWDFTLGLFSGGMLPHIPTIMAAALAATLSFLFYYRAMTKQGAARAMALNITYTAWAIIFTVVWTRNTDILNPLTVISALTVVVCGILAATDIKEIIRNGGTNDN